MDVAELFHPAMHTHRLIIGPKIIPFIERRSPARFTDGRWINPLEHLDWDAKLTEQNHSDRSIFHSSAWANVLAGTYGYEPIYVVGRQSGNVCSFIPFMEVRSAFTGKRAIALPFTDKCEPLCADKAEFEELFRSSVEIGKARKWRYLEFRGGTSLFGDVPASVSYYGHTLTLPANESHYFGQLKSPVRRAIRKAEKSGVRVDISRERDTLEAFYTLHCKTRRKHGLPPQPFAFFENIHKHILGKGMGVTILARWKRKPIAGAIFFHSGDAAIYKFGASDDRYLELRGNNLIFWEGIRWFLHRGAKTLDFGRTSLDNEGLRRFKLGWKAVESSIGYFRFSLELEQFIQAKDDSSGWHNHAFNALPLFASRMIGNVLYRHWA